MATVLTSSRRRLPRVLVVAAVVLVGLVLVVVPTIAVLAVRVEGRSMTPTLDDGDRVLLRPFSGAVQRFDVVVAHVPDTGELVKRVIAVAGDEVRIEPSDGAEPVVLVRPAGHGGWSRVDNPAWAGRWAGSAGACCDASGRAAAAEAAVVPQGAVFLLGDDVGVSRDSRTYGWVREDDVRGRVWLRVYPPSRFGGLDQPCRLVPVTSS